MPIDELIRLSHALGDPSLDAAILAEGNTSCKADAESFWVKASGKNLATMGEADFVRVAFDPVLRALQGPKLSDEGVKRSLDDSIRKTEGGAMPSVETFMHAFLLGLSGVAYVGHTHPTPLLSLLCLEGASNYASQRLFPDEVVCCGAESVYVRYEDPGLPLARLMAKRVEEFVERRDESPKTIWMQNHGLIALGGTISEVESATRMSIKAARVTLGALQTGQALRWLSPGQIARIHKRPDEHYRQRMLWDKGA